MATVDLRQQIFAALQGPDKGYWSKTNAAYILERLADSGPDSVLSEYGDPSVPFLA